MAAGVRVQRVCHVEADVARVLHQVHLLRPLRRRHRRADRHHAVDHPGQRPRALGPLPVSHTNRGLMASLGVQLLLLVNREG